jgi:hypothetical protein
MLKTGEPLNRNDDLRSRRNFGKLIGKLVVGSYSRDVPALYDRAKTIIASFEFLVRLSSAK